MHHVRPALLTALLLAATPALAQDLALNAPPASFAHNPATPFAAGAASSAGGIDGYRLLAVAAGLAGGWVVAGLVTEGILLPVLANTRFGGAGASSFRTAMQSLGAVFGGMSVDTRYMSR